MNPILGHETFAWKERRLPCDKAPRETWSDVHIVKLVAFKKLHFMKKCPDTLKLIRELSKIACMRGKCNRGNPMRRCFQNSPERSGIGDELTCIEAIVDAGEDQIKGPVQTVCDTHAVRRCRIHLIGFDAEVGETIAFYTRKRPS